MTNRLQREVFKIFSQQERDFKQGCFTRDFNQNWKLDANEIATVGIPSECQVFFDIFDAHTTNLVQIDRWDVRQDQIKALAMVDLLNGSRRILMQRFFKTQVLDRHFLTLTSQGTFDHLEDVAFCLGDRIVCVVEDELIKFKNYKDLRRFMDVSWIVREATRNEVSMFIENDLFDVPHPQNFHKVANTITRERIYSILTQGLLNQQNVRTLKERAEEAGVHVQWNNNKIVMPERSVAINELLHFLNDGRYRGPVSNRPMMANSYRPADTSVA
ncbi:MAG: DUF4868 domain-containing protein [Gammaproteobacteria bacterium]|nr:DUF4868 domain-containing protein [Gammaproteobacteria bacterium]